MSGPRMTEREARVTAKVIAAQFLTAVAVAVVSLLVNCSRIG